MSSLSNPSTQTSTFSRCWPPTPPARFTATFPAAWHLRISCNQSTRRVTTCLLRWSWTFFTPQAQARKRAAQYITFQQAQQSSPSGGWQSTSSGMRCKHAACIHNSLVSAHCKQISAFGKKEAVPIPAALVACWERAVCDPLAPLTTKLVLGAALVCTHASIRFGDAQRVHWSSLQLSAAGMHATAYATKTTKSGQPFACAWHGYTGRDANSSWVLRWLASVASISTAHPDLLAEGEPDFLFPHADMQCHTLACLAPASYARTLLCLRWASQAPLLCQHSKLSPEEARALTLHSMKSTALASAAQLHLAREDRLSQAHHRDSARLYSRNDTFASLHVQREIALALTKGWRPQRSMARAGACPIPEPPLEVPKGAPPLHLAPADIVGGPWALFASRHEHTRNRAAQLPARPRG